MCCQHLCLVLRPLEFRTLAGRFVLTSVVPTLQVTQNVSLVSQVQRVVKSLAHLSCLFRAPGCAFHWWVLQSNFPTQLPSTHPFAIAFASASAELNDVQASVTLQCLNWYSSFFSTPPEVDRIVFEHPAQTLSTLTFDVLFVLTNRN